MLRTAFLIIIILPLLAGSILLQIFLSRRQNKWLGLIIPIICFMISIATVLSIAAYTNTGVTSVTDTVDGAIVSEKTVDLQSVRSSMPSVLATAIPVFLITNIPTVIFLAIYIACREKIKVHDELDKMNIQDLE